MTNKPKPQDTARPREWWFHEDDNCSKAAAEEHNINSVFGAHKYKWRCFVEISAYISLRQDLEIERQMRNMDREALTEARATIADLRRFQMGTHPSLTQAIEWLRDHGNNRDSLKKSMVYKALGVEEAIAKLITERDEAQGIYKELALLNNIVKAERDEARAERDKFKAALEKFFEYFQNDGITKSEAEAKELAFNDFVTKAREALGI